MRKWLGSVGLMFLMAGLLVAARVVTDGKQVIELNIVLDDEDGTTVVAVPPKPAPKK
jgi:hypothetical protein